MLVLPNGRAVDLSINRARYHALRRQIVQAASLTQLYHVVDVIYRKRSDEGDIRRGWTEHDYDYSGFTAADIRLQSGWAADDIACFYAWLKEKGQMILIESARRRLEGCHNNITVKHNSSPQYLYSHLRRHLEKLPMQRASVAQWCATINNLKNNGLKQEELDWSGLFTHLKKMGDKTTIIRKSDILAGIDFSNINIELSLEQIWGKNGGLCFREVAQRMEHQVVYRAALKLDQSCHCVLRYVDEACNYRIGVVKTLAYGHYMALNRYWFVLDPYGRAIADPDNPESLFFSGSEQAMQVANDHAQKNWGLKGGASFHTRYQHLTLFGGRNYREWLVTLPDYQRSFFGAHYYDHNVLAHVRTTSRLDSAGRKLLFIEELQSDWHQLGSKHGYDNSCWGTIANAPFKKDWLGLVLKLMLIRASQNGYDGIAWPFGEIQELRYSSELAGIKRRYDVDIPKLLNRLGRATNDSVTTSRIKSKDPWLNLVQSKDKWGVADCEGKFCTRTKYRRDQAMEIIARHSKLIDLEVPAFMISDEMRRQIANQGLPLFGECIS